MIRKLVKYGVHYCAVEHADNDQFFFLKLKRKKKELVLSSKGEAVNFDELVSKIQGQKHLFLVVNNEQVLTKKVVNTHTTEERLVKVAFPNIALSDFYYKVYTNDQEAFVAISRKEYVNGIIADYERQKISVVDFSLGSLSLERLIDLIDSERIETSNAEVTSNALGIASIEKKTVAEKIYTINDLEVSNKHVLPLAGVIDYYAGGVGESRTQKQLQQEYIQKRFFNLGFKLVLGFLFVILLINFLIFSSYQSKDQRYSAELQVNEAKKKELTGLKDLVFRKRKLVESISSSSNSKVAWYFNEISASIPSSILLKNMAYQPVNGAIKENKRVRFKNKTIEISGVSIYDKDFTQWVATLEKKTWIDEVGIINYGRGKKTRSSFDLIITLNE
ncbi:hypothetical protein RQM59_02520 [Flavobacteriaceae bacterium S356]|uniref:Uncharacterized protein n=1 Tax=Asprobacillus argus TaxID=3076534 RepID=A0ABU3LDF4_9FLAO|nr:hypothetical protein [Flavobacteriaceae bacterium S356]